MNLLPAALWALCLIAGGTGAHAATLRVAPVGLDLTDGQNASTLTLRNDGADILNVQIRVFRWRQEGGKDVLEPATEVVVSPPITRLDAGGLRTVRVVRTGTAALNAEEAYRILVDELPPPPGDGGRMVALLMRHSIPVFFNRESGQADVVWHIDKTEGGLVLSAENKGARRVRLADVRLLDAQGDAVAEHRGLVGYVLPGSKMKWPIGPADAAAPSALRLTTDTGPVHVTLAGH